MNEKYNILICFAKLGAGGIETACLTQIKEFARRGYNVFVLAEDGMYSEVLKSIEGVTHLNFKYDSRNSFNLNKIKEVVEIIIQNNIKLVYIHQIDCVSSVFSACIFMRIPYIAYVHHGILGVYDEELSIGNISNNFLQLYYKYAYKIITISELSKEENKERFNITEDKYKVIPNCIDFENFKTSNPININNVLLISRFEKDKGNGVINGLKFFKTYKKLNPDARLTIVGGGSKEDEVKEIIKSMNIECEMLGRRNDVKEIMEKNGIILGVDRCIQEAIALKRYAVVTGYENFQGLVLLDYIEEFSKNNFSKKSEEGLDYKEIAEKIFFLKEEEKKEITNGNYKWLIRNRNIQNNLCEIEDINNIKNPLENIDYKEVIEILFGELQYMHTWMQKEIDRGWDVRQQTEDYYLNRENWNKLQIQEKEKEIEQLKEENAKIKEQLNTTLNSNSWKLIERIRNNKFISKFTGKSKKD